MKIIQFGEGNFLRGFVDLYLDTLNKEGLGNFEVNIIKPIARGSLEKFYNQNNKYHVILRGRQNGVDLEEPYKVDCITNVYNPFTNNDKFYELAVDPEVKILISNTTEAGIVYDENDTFDKCPDITYPAKVTKWLYKRFKAGLGGLYLLPCELIDHNAEELYNCIDKYITLWGLEEEFRVWNNTQNIYCNTLVDRIVSGYPRDEETKEYLTKLIGEEDALMAVAEPYGLWVIEDKGDIKNILKEGHHNIDVVFTKDISYYKARKVRCLNGSHTHLVPLALMVGHTTVFDAMNDEVLKDFVLKTLEEEIIPFVSKTVPVEETTAFAMDVDERFFNPFLNHQLSAITLNSVGKWKARNLPSFHDYYNKHGKIPHNMTIGLANLIALYLHLEEVEDKWICHLPNRDIEYKDELKFLEYFKNGNTVHDFLSDTSIWGIDLTKFDRLETTIEALLEDINELYE